MCELRPYDNDGGQTFFQIKHFDIPLQWNEKATQSENIFENLIKKLHTTV